MTYALDRIKSVIPVSIGGGTAQPTFYIKCQETGEFFELTLTKQVSVSSSSKVTEHKAEDKTMIASNSVAYGNIIRYNGIISDVKQLTFTPYNYQGGKRSVAEYLESIETLREKGSLWDCYIDTELNPMVDCVLTSFSRTKGVSEGKYEWSVSLEFKQIRLSSSVTVTTIPAPSIPDTINGKSDQGNSSTKPAEEKGLQRTLLGKGLDSLGV